ncbi:Cupin domain protein [Variovorax sp. CF079]|uniref:cupin domain-containing protein n=1 Tax=Variovorax sp. CF079 TaxID=1882774 RepID=UPI000881BF1A|nr:cupin domain-containing protein [Variovorax sp. CF079]SDE53065.1 Cupin domain protein [Variovorax sp. CF079]
MALAHARALDVIDINPMGDQLPRAVMTSLIKTPALQLMRMVLRAGADVPQHSVSGTITVQCLEGEATVRTPSRACHLAAGRLVVLEGGEPHAVHALTDASLLVTILLHTGQPAVRGQRLTHFPDAESPP